MQNFIQPIHKHEDGLINTFTGRLFDYNNIAADMICIEDIANALANICRFGGHTRGHYSVAQHTLLVWHLVPDLLKPAALLHDAVETYVGDVVKPFKNLLGDVFAKFEKEIELAIFTKYGVPFEHLKLIKPYDMQALEIEHNYFVFGKLDFMQKFYEINELLDYETPRNQLLTLLREHFLQRELFYKP
ncbi:metal-dependent phosphohydrolase [Pedobacter ureilyticus]|uniref:HD domain-containing protein n=1 Tax=Pedobacter ureilyticus TaxID=1393051 RepID=A0ABW9J308_9SPHI|nr:metal-dependent phosphohydrolase [Pedobacter helvus]